MKKLGSWTSTCNMGREAEAAAIANPDLRDKVIEAHIKLVYNAASKFPLPLKDDLISEGILALYSCLENFDPDKGTRFAAYARPRVFYAMQNYAEAQSRTVFLDDEAEVLNAEELLLKKEGEEATERALLRLGERHPRHAELLRMIFFKNIPAKTIASEWCITEGRVAQIKARAFELLVKAIEDIDNGK